MTYCTGPADVGYGLGAVVSTSLNWTGWGSADKSTPQDRAQPLQQNPLVPYIERYYIPGYMRLSEKARQKAFGDAHKRGAFRAEPALQDLGGDGLKTGEPKAWTNYLEIQQGGLFGKILGGVGSVIGKLAKPLVKAVVPGGGTIVDIANKILPGGGPSTPPPPVTPPPTVTLPAKREPTPVEINTGPLPDAKPPTPTTAVGPALQPVRYEFQPSPMLIAALVGVALLPTLLNQRR